MLKSEANDGSSQCPAAATAFLRHGTRKTLAARRFTGLARPKGGKLPARLTGLPPTEACQTEQRNEFQSIRSNHAIQISLAEQGRCSKFKKLKC